MSTSTVRIFVSSPKLGLKPERLAVKAALERMRGAEFVGMELFGSRDEDAQTASLEEVDGSQLYIGIIGGRYGSGITHAEYGRARERGLKCLFYIQNDEAIRLRDDDPAAAKSLAGWIATITDSYRGHLVTHFSNADELATSVAADVHNWLYKRLAGETTAAASAGAMERLRTLLSQTRNARALREALLAAGIAAGDDLLDSLAALFPAALRQFLGGIDELPTDYAARIEGFLGEYLGTPESPVPFGGRANVFHDLDSWLDDAGAPPYLLVAAEAGRGKSAALVRWIRRHLGDPKTEIVFVPISIRFRTNLSNVFFPALAAKLARAHGEAVPTDVNLPAEVWRGIVAEYLRQPLSGGRSLVVVIDGLDEAAGWEAGPDLFPGTPPPGVRVIASARLTADAPSAAAWLKQLGWNERTAKALPLEFLTLDGVRDVVSGTGFPVSELSRDVDVIQQLFRLSEGDPLLIRLYVDQLRKQGDQAARLRPEDLEKIDPGLDGFFADWWRYQRKLWGEEGNAPLKERSVQAVLDLLSVAFGPLRREDILALATPDSELTKWTLDDALDPIRRFVIEEQSGLVFNPSAVRTIPRQGSAESEPARTGRAVRGLVALRA